MIQFNNKSYSGAVVKNDDSELIVTINTVDTLQDLCLALNGVKNVTETIGEASTVYNVNTATQIGSPMKDVYTINFSKKLTVMQEMSQAIDDLLVMVLEGDGNA